MKNLKINVFLSTVIYITDTISRALLYIGLIEHLSHPINYLMNVYGIGNII